MSAKLFDDFLKQFPNEWQIVIAHARKTLSPALVSDKELIQLTSACSASGDLSVVVRYLYQDSKENPIGKNGIHYLFELVDKSNFSLKEWIQAIVKFDDYLTANTRKTKFRTMLGFLACCEESPENKNSKFKFEKLLEKMLSEFGYDG